MCAIKQQQAKMIFSFMWQSLLLLLFPPAFEKSQTGLNCSSANLGRNFLVCNQVMLSYRIVSQLTESITCWKQLKLKNLSIEKKIMQKLKIT